MSTSKHQRVRLRDGLTFLLAAALVVTYLQQSSYEMSTPTLDALRYVDYALNIHDHGVFGMSGTRRDRPPAPGNSNSPLYPALLAGVIHIDSRFAESLRCAVVARRDAATCPRFYTTITAVQCALVVGALTCLWFTAARTFRRRSIAWLACALALSSTKLMFFANHLLTEVLVLFLFAALMAALALGGRLGAGLTGLLLGALTLTRPEYLYLAVVMGLIGATSAGLCRGRGYAAGLVTGVSLFALVVGPWLARNEHHFGTVGVTGGYGDVILAYRIAYNRMSVGEWGAAFIYWLPGHGEALAARWLPPHLIANLGTEPDSYLYRDSAEIFDAGLAAVNGEREKLTGYLIRNEILAHPLRHIYASIPLAWRGILAGKYLAVAGVPALAFFLLTAVRRRDGSVLLLMVPPMVMVALYAAVSVSVPRYNVYLIFYYGIAAAWLIVSLLERHLLSTQSVDLS